MLMYEINEQTLEVANVVESSARSTTKAQPPIWEQRLAAMIADAFSTQVIFASGATGEWRFIGIGAEAEVSRYAFEVLLRQLKFARKKHLETRCPNVSRETKTIRGDLFCDGWLDTVGQQIQKLATTVAHNKLIDQYMETQYPALRPLREPKSNQRAPNYHDWKSHQEGISAGHNAELNTGVGGDKNQGADS